VPNFLAPNVERQGGYDVIKKILVAVDGSKHSLKGVEYAAQIAAAMKAAVVLLHVVKQEKLPEGLKAFAQAEHLLGTDVDLLKKGAQFLLTGAIDIARGAGVQDVEIEVAEGPVARTIVAMAESRGMDLIVVGSRGMGDIEGLLRGGVSHRVEILAKCPVLVVK